MKIVRHYKKNIKLLSIYLKSITKVDFQKECCYNTFYVYVETYRGKRSKLLVRISHVVLFIRITSIETLILLIVLLCYIIENRIEVLEYCYPIYNLILTQLICK